MIILVTGANGQIGSDVINELLSRGHRCVGGLSPSSFSLQQGNSADCSIQYVQMDITNREDVFSTINNIKPDAVIHCAAWTNVDAAEKAENAEIVKAINYYGTQNIADACNANHSKMIYLSTDYVFDGTGSLPWEPDEVNCYPLNYYGKTKLWGERAVSSTLSDFFIVRISWAFGKNGKNFVRTMLNIGRNRGSVRVVSDQIGLPTYSKDLAVLLSDMIETDKYGYYYATSSGDYISWYDFTSEIYKLSHIDTEVVPILSSEYSQSLAVRPLNSRLNTDKLTKFGFNKLPDWKDALLRYLKETEDIKL